MPKDPKSWPNLSSMTQGRKGSQYVSCVFANTCPLSPLPTQPRKINPGPNSFEINNAFQVDPFFDELKAMNTAGKLGSNELKVENDNLAIEVRMGQVLSKGMVVKELLKSNPRTRMAVCFGDSNADEDMIKTLKSSGLPVVATFHVKNNKYLETKAMHKMETPQQAVDLLRAFYDMEPKKIELKKEN
jgi:hypothetical protein